MMIKLTLVGLALLMLAGCSNGSPELDNYCEMRTIWIDSNGEYGWPAGAHGKFNDGECGL